MVINRSIKTLTVVEFSYPRVIKVRLENANPSTAAKNGKNLPTVNGSRVWQTQARRVAQEIAVLVDPST